MERLNEFISAMMYALCNGVFDAVTEDSGTQKVIVVQRSDLINGNWSGGIRNRNDKLRLVRSKNDLTSRDQVFSLSGDLIEQTKITQLTPSETDFHPAVKLNAMLVLRDLNDTQPKKGKPETAIPRNQTQRDLIAYLEAADDLSDISLIGALCGIERHVKLQPIPELQSRIARVVAPIADIRQGSTRSDAAATWIRRKAVDILGFIGEPGDKNTYVAKLYKIIRNKNTTRVSIFTLVSFF